MLKDLIKLADHLDRKGLAKEANFLDGIIKNAHEDLSPYFKGDTVIDESGSPQFDLPEVDERTRGHSRGLEDVVTMIRELDGGLREELLSLMASGGELSMG